MKSAIACACSLVTVLSLSQPVRAAPAPETLCAAQEKVIFSCQVGKKIVSVCASRDFPAPASTLQYRFGRKDALELSTPKDDKSRQGVTSGSIAYSRGGGAYLGFVNDATRYVVYSVVRDGGATEAQGLAVNQGDKVLGSFRCKHGTLINNVEPGYAGIPEDPQGFDVP